MGAQSQHATQAPADYGKPAPAPRLVLERVLDIDLERGLVIERLRLH